MTYRLAPLTVVGPDASLEEVAASTAVQLFRERAGARMRGALDTERACRLFGEICAFRGRDMDEGGERIR